MFICPVCSAQSLPGEPSVVVPSTLRRVTYLRKDLPVSHGMEWSRSLIICQPCASDWIPYHTKEEKIVHEDHIHSTDRDTSHS